jgi:predicted nucleic acid-binding protein
LALIIDTGPLLAAMNDRDPDHARCQALLRETVEPRIVPAPVVYEMDYWIRQRMRPRDLVAFLNEILDGYLVVEELHATDYQRIRDLCDRYADSDLGFVDAAVLAIVERLNEPKLATLDHRHFRMLRPRHVDVLTLLPD